MKHRLRAFAALIALLIAAPASADDAAATTRPLLVLEPHTFSREEARVRVQQLLDYWSKRFGVRRNWRGDVAEVRGHVMGVVFNARLVVHDHEVRAEASDPGFLVRGVALDYVHRKLRKYLDPVYAEQ